MRGCTDLSPLTVWEVWDWDPETVGSLNNLFQTNNPLLLFIHALPSDRSWYSTVPSSQVLLSDTKQSDQLQGRENRAVCSSGDNVKSVLLSLYYLLCRELLGACPILPRFTSACYTNGYSLVNQ